MRLPKPFFRLPLRFDAARLAAEVAALPAAAWAEHPNHLAGNSCVRLISVDGGENDSVDGPMAATAHLARLPYVQQLLACSGTSAPGASRISRDRLQTTPKPASSCCT